MFNRLINKFQLYLVRWENLNNNRPTPANPLIILYQMNDLLLYLASVRQY